MGITDMGSIGGLQGPSPLAFFNPEVWRPAYEEYAVRNLVLGNLIPVDTIPAKDFRYPIVDPILLDAGKEYPDFVEPGAEFPTITVSDVAFASGIVKYYGYKRKLDPAGQRDARMVLRQRQAMTEWMADYLEKSIFEDITGLTLDWDAMTASGTLADGDEFDTFFDVGGGQIQGGWNDGTVGTQNTLLFGQQDGYEWDSENGNPVMDWLRIGTVLEDQIRAAGSNAPDGQMVHVPWDLANTEVLTDSMSYNTLFAYLVNKESRNYPMVNVTSSSFTVPGLGGMTFRKANRAMPIGTVDIGGVSTGYGLALIYDRTNLPWQGYQWFPDNWNGWSRAGVVNGWDFMAWSNFIPDERGIYQAAMWFSKMVKIDQPRKFAMYGGFRSGEGF